MDNKITLFTISQKAHVINHIYEHCLIRAIHKKVIMDTPGATFSYQINAMTYRSGLILIQISAQEARLISVLGNFVANIKQKEIINQLPAAIREVEYEDQIRIKLSNPEKLISMCHSSLKWKDINKSELFDAAIKKKTTHNIFTTNKTFNKVKLSASYNKLGRADPVLALLISDILALEITNTMDQEVTFYRDDYPNFQRSPSGRSNKLEIIITTEASPNQIRELVEQEVKSLTYRAGLVSEAIHRFINSSDYSSQIFDQYGRTGLILSSKELKQEAKTPKINSILNSVKISARLL